MHVYYNENDPQCAAWLRELIAQGHLPAGDVDERSIEDVRPADLTGYRQCHFFAGIGGWALALEWAGWTGPVWTGSCPCQPFSAAGARGGVNDPRHLWPAWRWLIDQCRPATVFGEQVASKAGREWLTGVQTDLQAMGYATAGADLCAASVGAPHIRQRLWWVGHTLSERPQGHARHGDDWAKPGRDDAPEAGSVAQAGGDSGVANRTHSGRHEEHTDAGGFAERNRAQGRPAGSGAGCGDSGVADAGRARGVWRENAKGLDAPEEREWHESTSNDQPCSSFGWAGAELIPCADGKQRRIEPGTQPLVDGLPRGVVPSGDPGAPGYAQNTGEARKMRLSGYGNAIVPQVAAAFITAYMEATR